MDNKITIMQNYANKLADDAAILSQKMQHLSELCAPTTVSVGIDPFLHAISIFILACFIGYYVVWRVLPSLHTPLMALTNAISGIIIIGAMIAMGKEGFGLAQFVGFFAVILAAINIFGGFIVTHRMLNMFRKK